MQALPVSRGSQDLSWLQASLHHHVVSLFAQLNQFYGIILGEASRGSCSPPCQMAQGLLLLVPLILTKMFSLRSIRDLKGAVSVL